MAKNNFVINNEYKEFIQVIKDNIKKARYIAIKKVNSELIILYYNIGRNIVLKQRTSNGGDNLIGQIEKDLKKEFPNLRGFSRTNLFYMKKLYLFFDNNEKIPQLVGQIPWGHIRLILDKIKEKNEALFYIKQVIENSWSRVILEHQIESDLYHRKGKISNHFSLTLPKKEAEIIIDSFKENYLLDFLNLSEDIKEKELEDALIKNIVQFLMELGRGFAFIGKQYKIVVGGDEFFIDLLFYNYILKRFVVIELKTKEFKPEYTGQIGFYMTAIDKDLKQSDDKSTIGLLICKSKNKTVVEYALSNNKKPLGVAEYKLSKLPKDVSKYLPDEKEIENTIKEVYDRR